MDPNNDSSLNLVPPGHERVHDDLLIYCLPHWPAENGREGDNDITLRGYTYGKPIGVGAMMGLACQLVWWFAR